MNTALNLYGIPNWDQQLDFYANMEYLHEWAPTFIPHLQNKEAELNDLCFEDFVIPFTPDNRRVAIEAEKNGLGVWTLVDDGLTQYLISGWHFVGSIGYAITAIKPPLTRKMYVQQ